MDRFELLHGLDKVARAMRGLGLARVTRFGRNVLDKALASGLEVEADGLHLAGSVLHRSYLVALREGSKESFMTSLFADAVRPGMTVLDIGAYIGWYMLVAARKTGTSGRVYAFETDPRNYGFVLRNIEANHVSRQVVPVPRAVAGETGIMNLFMHDSDSSKTSLFEESPRACLTSVDAISLDEYFPADSTVNVIKMDIEGGEIRALEGMTALLGRSASVTMFVECNPKALRTAGGSSEALLQKLASLGFEIEVIDEENQCLRPVAADVHDVRYVNLYCRKQECPNVDVDKSAGIREM